MSFDLLTTIAGMTCRITPSWREKNAMVSAFSLSTPSCPSSPSRAAAFISAVYSRSALLARVSPHITSMNSPNDRLVV